MSVPPPSWVPNSTSTGSSSWSVRSTTAVSKTTSDVRSDRIDASTAPNTPRTRPTRPSSRTGRSQSTTSRCDAAGAPRVADQPLRDDRAVAPAGSACRLARIVRSQSMSRCRGRSIRRGPVERAGHRGPGRARPSARSSSSTTLRDHLAARSPWSSPASPVEREQRADQVDVGLDRVQHLRLQQQPGQVEPLDRVALHDLHDVLGK